MKSREKQIDTQKSKDQRHKSDNRHDGGFPPPPSHGEALVQHGGIEEPGNQGPCLFWIPSPVSSPGIFRPDGSGDDPKGQQWKSKGQGPVVEVVENLERRKPLCNGSHLLRFELMFLDEINHSATEGQSEEGVA